MAGLKVNFRAATEKDVDSLLGLTQVRESMQILYYLADS